MESSYPLYHTLNINIPKTKFTKAQEQDLKEKLSKLEKNTRKAVIMLIAEHSRLTEGPFDTADLIIPYEGVQDGDDTTFDLKNFPNELKWILWKFTNLGSKK